MIDIHWKRCKGTEEGLGLSVVYKQYSKDWGGYYLTHPEKDDLYITLNELNLLPKEL